MKKIKGLPSTREYPVWGMRKYLSPLGCFALSAIAGQAFVFLPWQPLGDW